jgi:hypothetical protein
MLPNRRLELGTLVMLLVLSAFRESEGATYEFTLIADSSAEFKGLSSTVPLNAAGTVAFYATLKSGGAGIFSGNGGLITTVADTTGELTLGFSGIAINDFGTVAFPSSEKSGGVGAFSGNGGPITTIADRSDGLAGVGEPVSINNSGTVALTAALAEGVIGIMTGSGGPVSTIYDTHPGGQFYTFGAPAINNQGTLAFLAGVRGNPDSSAIFTSKGGSTLTTIVEDTGELTRLTARPDINDFGFVAFDAAFDAGGAGIFIGNGGPLKTIADTAGPFKSFPAETPVINNSGEVAFLATLDIGGVGIFSGPDPVTDKILRTGDFLFGSEIIDLPSNGARLGLNDSGQVAFEALLADGRDVIVRADPIAAVPESSAGVETIAFLVLCGMAFVARQSQIRSVAYLRPEQTRRRRQTWPEPSCFLKAVKL